MYGGRELPFDILKELLFIYYYFLSVIIFYFLFNFYFNSKEK